MSIVNYKYHATYKDFREFKKHFYKTNKYKQKNIPLPNLVATLLFLKLPFQYRTLPHKISKSKINVCKTYTLSLALLDSILEVDNKNFLKKTIEYELAEPTFKTAYSNFLGTAVAAYVAMIKYDIEFPYHIHKNQYFSTENYSRAGSLKSKPDLFGITDNIGYIFEAKGSTSSKYGDIHDQVKKGKKQKRRISWVKNNTSGVTYRNDSLKRRIISTSFNNSNELQVHDIDPDPEVVINYDENLAIYDYYEMFYYCLKEDAQNKREIIRVENEEFIFTSIGEYKFGLLYSVFKRLDSYNNQYSQEFGGNLNVPHDESNGLYKFIHDEVQKFNIKNETIHKMKNLIEDSNLNFLLNGVVTYYKKDEKKLINKGNLTF